MLVTPPVQQGRISYQIASALERSTEIRLWEAVQPGPAAGTYTVPSQSRPGLRHTVSVRARRGGEPVYACYQCSCEAGRRAACVHRAAVYQSLVLAHRGALPVRVDQAALAQPVPPPAPSVPVRHSVKRVDLW